MYICSWSGGEDSTASIILAHLNNEPLDIILFSEVMYDKTKEISGENPEHIDFIKNKAIPLFESWGYDVRILRAEKDYLDCFNRVINKPIKKMENKGKKYGFALAGMCSVKRDCKEKPIKDFYKTINEPVIQYVGICSDEKKRLESMHKNPNKISLLEKYGYTKKMNRELCEKYDLRSTGYKFSKRGGCWFCPYSKLEEMQQIRSIWPEAWNQFVSMEGQPDVANNRWSIHRESLSDIEKKLKIMEKEV